MMKLKHLALCALSVVATGSTYAQNVQVSVGNTSSIYQDAVFSKDSISGDQYYVVNFGSSNIYFAKNDGSDGVHLAEIDQSKGKITIGFSSEGERGPKVSVSNYSQGWATYCSPFLLKVPTDAGDAIKVYAPTYDSNTLRINSTTQVKSGKLLTIGTPLLIKANTTPASTANYYFGGHSTCNGTDDVTPVITTPANNALSGTIHQIDAPSETGKTLFTLGKSKNTELTDISFYVYSGSVINNCKSYLFIDTPTFSSTSTSKYVTLCEDEFATEINGITDLNHTKSTDAYNLSGQRVNATAKGFIIINGKKFINK